MIIFDADTAMARPDVLSLVREHWTPPMPQIETVPLASAINRVLASDLHARFMIPAHRVSSFDGIAVRAADFADGVPDLSSWREGVEYQIADTGDDFDDRFDSIIAKEHVTFHTDGTISLPADEKVELAQHVTAPGSTLREGELLLSAGTLLRPRYVGLLASGGYTEVPVVRKLRVSFIPTGNELVPAGTTPVRGQNVESNSLLAAALLDEYGCEPVIRPLVQDKTAELSQALDEALASTDVVLINAGTSAGHDDLNAPLLLERATIFQHGVKAVPGRPVSVAIIDGKLVINVPGPPVGAMLAFDWLVRSVVCHFYRQPVPRRHQVTAVLEKPIGKPPGFESVLQAHAALGDDGRWHVWPMNTPCTLAERIRQTNAVVVTPAAVSKRAVGELVPVELLFGLEHYGRQKATTL